MVEIIENVIYFKKKYPMERILTNIDGILIIE